MWVLGDIFSNVPIRFCFSSGAMVLRLDTSIIASGSSFLNIPCSGNTFSQYRIWAHKDDSGAIDWFSSCPFPSVPSCVIVFASAVSATYASFYSPDFSSWYSGSVVDGT